MASQQMRQRENYYNLDNMVNKANLLSLKASQSILSKEIKHSELLAIAAKINEAMKIMLSGLSRKQI